jgi:hypothetical protein
MAILVGFPSMMHQQSKLLQPSSNGCAQSGSRHAEPSLTFDA